MNTHETRARQTVDVLVVDDDSDATEELIQFLSKAGLKCRSAADGWSALKAIAEGCQPRVVVSDLRMPELDGLQFAEHLNKIAPDERPEIVFVSGNAGFEDAVQALRLGARDMLTKPIDGPRLVRAVKSALLICQSLTQRSTGGDTEQREGMSPTNPVERRRASLNDMRAVRKVRSRYFPSELFSDPCWEMLLDLYDAELDGAEVSVTSLGAASGVPLTTALRRMDALQGHGFIERVVDPQDKRRIIVRLTKRGGQAVERFFEAYTQRQGR